ncbi:tetratricopeptide repeat protein [Fluviicoccus keumensis]|uniref:Tetratricopeptide repeat protein n=1 Tax=Fluviicoccus keumensis TaxID=1435465 RepID=A0A4Q7ZCA9_9GAMM|nr:tetratricopeptide repeat protein [Fluviicoccus keumensis]RZU47633.1 tetratricopeptide repeat protein [Fluviicoccus keumensis]
MKSCRAILLLGLCGPALAAAPLEEQAGIPQTPFENTRYTLGFEVYVAGGKLPAAWQVARKAVAERPSDPVWLKRYAQVSEWVGQPAEALAAWLKLARLGGSEESWSAVGRLAPMLLDDEALLAYRQRLAGQRPGDRDTLLRLIETYERLGRPEAGLAFLKTLENRQAGSVVLEAEATLAERSGQDEAAIAALSRLLARTPTNEGWLLRRASLQYRRGQLAEARAGLAAVEPRMPVAATGYWQTYADLSRLLNDGETARRAYQVLVAQGKDGESDLWNYASLLQDSDPLAAAGMQERLYRRFGRDNGAINALSLWQSEHAWTAIDGFLDGLSAVESARLSANPAFLEQRARYYWLRGRLADARRDYRQGLQLSPASVRLTQGLAGVLLAQDDAPALRQLLVSRDTLARRSEALWPAWIAGWQRLRQPATALPYQLAWQQRHPEDALAALALADTLQAVNQPEAAERLRRLILARAGGYLDAESPERRQQLQDALLALNLPRMLPDRAWRQLTARRRAAPDTFSRDLMLGWLLNHEATDSAMALAAETSAAQPLPGWADLGFALTAGDRGAMDALLNQRVEELPVYDRLEAAERLQRNRLATDLAFRTLEDEAPDDDELHHRFTRLGAANGRRLDVQSRRGRQSGLDLSGVALGGNMPLDDRNRLVFAIDDERASRRDQGLWGTEPAARREWSVGLNRQTPRSRWHFGLHGLDGVAANNGFRVSQDYTMDRTLALDWLLDRHGGSRDSLAMHLAGMDNRAVAGLRWTPDGRLSVNARLEQHRYQAQTGEGLGRGRVMAIDTGFRLFAAQPDQVLKLQLGVGQFSDDANTVSPLTAALIPAGTVIDSRFFMPADYRQWALAWAFGQLPEDRLARGWRSFGEIGFNRSDNSGNGYRLELGLHGPVLGGDSLQLQFRADRSGLNQGNDTRELRLDYRIFY